MPTDRTSCSACGSSNEADAMFCENCGARLTPAVAAPAHAQPAPAQAAPVHANAPPPQQKSRAPLMLAALVIVGGGAAWALGAPMPSFLSKVGIKTRGADSVQLAPSAQNPALADTAVRPGTKTAQPGAPSLVPPAAPTRVSQNTSPQPTRQTNRTSSAGTPPPPEFPTAPTAGGAASYPGFNLPTPPAESPPPVSTNPSPSQPAPAAAPAPAPVAPRPAGRIAAGTMISLRSASQVCSDKAQQGTRFTATVDQDVTGENGATIPRGTAMTFVVDRSKPATASEKAQFSIAAESVPVAGEPRPVKANIDAVTIKEKSRSIMGALVGAAAAAAAARAAGGDAKTTIGGAAAGGVAGAVIGNQIRSGNGCIEKNAPIRITLSSDITT